MAKYEPRTGHYGADCFQCQGSALFSNHQFHNNGLASADRGLAKHPANGFNLSTTDKSTVVAFLKNLSDSPP